MHKTFDFKKYVEYKVYSVTTIKNGYGFRVLLTFADESTKTQQHAGFTTKREANAFRDEVIGQLHNGTYIVYGKIWVEEFMIFWLEERKTYEKNRRRRPKEFRDWNYICCSTYGNPRSKGFHQKYYKDLLKSLDLPDIHFHQLRNTYATILLKNSFNSKGVLHLLGHAKEIISVDVYGDTQEIIEDCLDVLEPFIEEVIPKERKDQYYDYSEVIEIDLILKEYFNAA